MKKLVLPHINIYLLFVVHIGSFFTVLITIFSMGAAFWMSAGVFALTTLYISYDRRRLENELDDIFGDSDRFI